MKRRSRSWAPALALSLLAAASVLSCVSAGDVGGGTPPPSGGSGGAASGGQGGSTATGGSSGSGGATVDAGLPGTGGGSGGGGGAAGGGGGTAGTGGSGGAGTGGAAGASDGGAGGAPALPPLAACSTPAVSRLKVWEMMTVSGSAVPASGSPLRKFGDAYELHVAWTLQGGGYGTANTPLKNMGQYANGANPATNAADISAEPGLTLEYATTGNTYVQIRTGAVPHGGAHFRANLPVTAGEIKTVTLPFADFRRPGGTTPPGPDVLKDAFSLTFVAGATSTLTLRQVRVGAFVPPCN